MIFSRIPSNMAATREWAEACIADPNECHVDALKFPGSHGFTGNEEDESPLTRNQIALILAAFHAVNCIGVEPVIDVPDSAELERVMKKVLRSRNGEELIEFPNKVARDNEDFNRKCARYLSWHVIRGKVREPGDGFLDWIVRILRRFECMLEECRATSAASRSVRIEPQGMVEDIAPKSNHELLKLSEQLKLIGKQARVLNALAEHNCRIALVDLAINVEWQSPYLGTWNSMKTTLNKKLKRHGWRIRQHDMCAVAERLPVKSPAQK